MKNKGVYAPSTVCEWHVDVLLNEMINMYQECFCFCLSSVILSSNEPCCASHPHKQYCLIIAFPSVSCHYSQTALSIYLSHALCNAMLLSACSHSTWQRQKAVRVSAPNLCRVLTVLFGPLQGQKPTARGPGTSFQISFAHVMGVTWLCKGTVAFSHLKVSNMNDAHQIIPLNCRAIEPLRADTIAYLSDITREGTQ